MRALGVAAGLTLIAALVGGGARWKQESDLRTALLLADIDRITDDPLFARLARERGSGIFQDHCAACHASTGRGDRTAGTPDLTDRDFLYGVGRASEVEQIVLHGIRSGDSKGWRLAVMPAYAAQQPSPDGSIRPLTPIEIADTVQFLLARAGRAHDARAAQRGEKVFTGSGGCWDCHDSGATGDSAIGAPNLADRIWLYGDGSPVSISRSISEGRHGRCPAFARRLDPASVRWVAMFVALLSPRTRT